MEFQGTYRWIENMQWSGKPAFDMTSRDPIYITAYTAQAGYVQRSGQFSVFTILRSGHMVSFNFQIIYYGLGLYLSQTISHFF